MEPQRFGAYTFVEKLGRGGMAEVFLARADSAAGVSQLLAVKRLLGSFNDDSQLVSMLADEARLSVWLYHPNIVQVFDFGCVEGLHYIAMEYVDGCDLMTLLRDRRTREGRPLPLATAIYTLLQIAEALDYAHRRTAEDGSPLGIIHRDVSPHNVLVSREGQVKLADFGLARAAISVHQSATGIIRGKFAYMPKEQAHGRAIDQRIDIFAAGVTLYEALTGVRPYNSSNLAQQLYQLEGEVPPPSSHVPDIPEEIDELTLQAISPSAEERYQSAAEMADDLRHALSALSTPNQEAQHLAALVAAWAPQAPTVAQERIQVDPRDLAIPVESLIEDEVRAMRLTISGKMVASTEPLPEAEEVDTFRAPPPNFAAGERRAATEEQGEEDEFDRAATLYFPGREEAPLAPDERPGAKARRKSRLREESPPPTAKRPEKKPAIRPTESQDDGELDVPDLGDSVLHEPERDDPDGDGPDEVFATGSIENSAVLKKARERAQRRKSGEQARREQTPTAGEKRRDQALSEALRSGGKPRRRPRRAHHERVIEEEQQTHALRRPEGKSKNLALLLVALALVGAGLGAGWLLRGDADPPPSPRYAATPSPPLHNGMAPAMGADMGEASVSPGRDAGARDTRADQLAAIAPLPPRATPRKPRAATKRRPKRAAKGPRRPRTPKKAPAQKLPPHGVLMITCERPATIFIDDRRVGATPARVALPPGIHRVKLLYTDTREYSSVRFVTVDKGSQSILRF